MGVAGNIEAIRDWGNTCFYTKEEISDFFIKADSGLTAYKFTIIGPANTNIGITEDASSNPQTYNIKLSETGDYSGLFFFHSGSTLTLTRTGYTPQTYVLNSYEDIIYISGYEIVELIPAMSSLTSQEGNVISYMYSGQNIPAVGYGTADQQWKAFDRLLTDCANISQENVTGAWIGFEFTNPVAQLRSIKGILSNYLQNNSFNCKYQYYKNNEWHDYGNGFIVAGYSTADPATSKVPVSYGTFEINSYAENVEKIRFYVDGTKTSGTNVMAIDLRAYGVASIS